MADYFAHIARQRYAVADVLDTLKGDEWSSPSLCDGWRIQEMAAHLTMPFRVSKSRFLLSVVGTGGNIAKVMESFVRAHSGEPADELIGSFHHSLLPRRRSPKLWSTASTSRYLPDATWRSPRRRHGSCLITWCPPRPRRSTRNAVLPMAFDSSAPTHHGHGVKAVW